MLYELGHEAPSWWEDWNDPVRGYGMAELLDRCRRTNTCPKIMETFGCGRNLGPAPVVFSWSVRRRRQTSPLPARVRRYYFPGVAHGGGQGGFSSDDPAGHDALRVLRPDDQSGAERSDAIGAAESVHGLGDEWHADAAEHVPAHCRRHAGAANERRDGIPAGFPAGPSPDGVLHPLLDYDLGPEFNYRDQSGIASQNPEIKGVLPQLVPRVDADGNEVAGIKSPLQMAPLGTYTGWNVISSGMFKGQLCHNNGTGVAGFIPFAVTKAERLASGDPRLSLEERYQTHDGYVNAVAAAADSLVKQGYLLRADADAMVVQANGSNILR